MHQRHRSAFLSFAGLLASLALASHSHAQQILPPPWGVDGAVYSTARSGDTLYLGGAFNLVGTPTGGGIPVDPRSGRPLARFPRVSGAVYAAIPDGRGGWFIGGNFNFVEGEARASLAHVLPNGRLARWSPVIYGEVLHRPYQDIHPAVHALALRGDRLYVGGYFTSVNGVSRRNLVAIDARSGELLDWAPNPDGDVRALLLRDEKLYVGGYFTTIADSARPSLAALHARSGRLTPWNPGADRAVLAFAPHGRTLFVAGQFDHLGGQPRNSVGAVDLASGRLLDWDAAIQPRRAYLAHGNWNWPYVQAIDVQDNTVYLGGWFSEAGGAPRESFAALDARTAEATAFDARLAPWIPYGYILVNALTVRGSTVYLGGLFGGAGGDVRANAAAFDTRSGALRAWDPRAAGAGSKWYAPYDPRVEGNVSVIASDDDAVYIGGTLTNMYDWQRRTGLAAVSLATGQVLPWAPEVEGLNVSSIAAVGNAVYLAGAFRALNAEVRDNSGAVDAVTGATLPWRHDRTYGVYARDGVLYVSGTTATSPGVVREFVGPVDLVTGANAGWTAIVDRGAEHVFVADHTLYLGGDFSSVAGGERRMFAAVDRQGGGLLPWHPVVVRGSGTGLATLAITATDDAVYLSGRFNTLNGSYVDGLAAVDPTSGGSLPWAPVPDNLVLALATTGGTVWAGGRFNWIDGQLRVGLAALDATTGEVSPWDPRGNGEVDAFLTTGDTLVVAGAFRAMGGFPAGGVALISVPPAAATRTLAADDVAPGGLALAVHPNPMPGEGRVRFMLPAAGAVSLAVFDVQGRCVETLLHDARMAAGTHEVALYAGGWSPGVYLCRVEAAGRSMTRKLLVVR